MRRTVPEPEARADKRVFLDAMPRSLRNLIALGKGIEHRIVRGGRNGDSVPWGGKLFSGEERDDHETYGCHRSD